MGTVDGMSGQAEPSRYGATDMVFVMAVVR